MSEDVIFFIMRRLCNVSVIYKTIGNRTIVIANNNPEKLTLGKGVNCALFMKPLKAITWNINYKNRFTELLVP